MHIVHVRKDVYVQMKWIHTFKSKSVCVDVYGDTTFWDAGAAEDKLSPELLLLP